MEDEKKRADLFLAISTTALWYTISTCFERFVLASDIIDNHDAFPWKSVAKGYFSAKGSISRILDFSAMHCPGHRQQLNHSHQTGQGRSPGLCLEERNGIQKEFL